MEILKPPGLDWRPAVPTLGLSTTTRYHGMLNTRQDLTDELHSWLQCTGLPTGGRWYLRFNSIDPGGDVSLEVGVLGVDHPGDHHV